MSKYTNPLYTLEITEMIQKLRDNGHGDIVDCLLENEDEVYTKKVRLNKSGTCRKLGCKNKQLEDEIKAMKELLRREFE